jgi:predicted RNase H-like nuclease
MRLLGIDGCKSGWVVISGDTGLGDLDCRIVAPNAIGSLFLESDQAGDLIAIDIPIGLAESAPRRCDVAARKLLGSSRASSVFPAPCRAALPATSYAEACELNEKASGRRISRQTFGILSKIRAVDTALTPALQQTVRESHPEVVFARLSDGGTGINSNKKTPEGRVVRQEILRRYLPEFDAEQIRITLGRSAVALDDVIDAAACLIAAHRIAQGTACVLPCDHAECDQRGLRMEIVA